MLYWKLGTENVLQDCNVRFWRSCLCLAVRNTWKRWKIKTKGALFITGHFWVCLVVKEKTKETKRCSNFLCSWADLVAAVVWCCSSVTETRTSRNPGFVNESTFLLSTAKGWRVIRELNEFRGYKWKEREVRTKIAEISKLEFMDATKI